ncbi:MAG: hypothetical protein AAB609_00665 [Patescibacteria group bacterium]
MISPFTLLQGNKKTLFFLNIALKNKPVLLTIVVLAVLADILLIPESSDIRIFITLGLYGISIMLYKLAGRYAFLFCLVLLGIMYIEFLFTGTSPATEKAAVWIFFFLLIGIIQQWKEE